MTITAEQLKDISSGAFEGELYCEGPTIWSSRPLDGGYLSSRVGRIESLDDGFFISKVVNAYRSGQLVHVDEVKNKLALPDCPEVLWAQRYLGRDDWQVSENVTPASMGVSASERFVNARELREATSEVEKLRAALRNMIAMGDPHFSDEAEMLALSEARAALGDSDD